MSSLSNILILTATSTAKEKQSSKRSYAIKKVHKKKSTKVLSYNGSKVLKEVVFLSMAAKENKGMWSELQPSFVLWTNDSGEQVYGIIFINRLLYGI